MDVQTRHLSPSLMTIKMLTTVVGSGKFHARNQVYDLPDKVADQYIAAKFAIREALNPPEHRTKAVKKPVETR